MSGSAILAQVLHGRTHGMVLNMSDSDSLSDQKENLYLPNKEEKGLWIKGYRLLVTYFPRPVLEPKLAGVLFACLRLDLVSCIRAGPKQALCVCERSHSIGMCLWIMMSGGGKGVTGSSARCSFWLTGLLWSQVVICLCYVKGWYEFLKIWFKSDWVYLGQFGLVIQRALSNPGSLAS